MIKKVILIIMIITLFILSVYPNYYASANAIRLADNMLLFQRNTGGWPKDVNMSKYLSKSEVKLLKIAKKNVNDSTIDNDATTMQMNHLARVYTAANKGKYKAAFIKGLDWLLEAQYDNGGWPQFYPLVGTYADNITFNDDAMLNVLTLFNSIIKGEEHLKFVDDKRKAQCKAAYDKGLECILKTQYKINGGLTAWGQQHDPKTLLPAQGRAFEPPSLSSRESYTIILFLMNLDKPSPEIITAIEAAVKWLDTVKIEGHIYIDRDDITKKRGFERYFEKDENSSAIYWARLYELDTNRPIFGDRKNVVFYSMTELSYERRTGYQWYTDLPAVIVKYKYFDWQKKWTPDRNILQ